MHQKFLTFSLALFLGAFSLDAAPPTTNGDYEKLNNIHSVEVISILNDVKPVDGVAKKPAEMIFDSRVRAYVVQAIGNRFSVKDDENVSGMLAGIADNQSDNPSTEIGDRIKAATPKPDVDAIIVVYPASYASVGLGFSFLPNKHFLFGKDTIFFSIGYAVGVYDTKTGAQIDYGTGRFRASNYITGYSPPWASCDGSLIPDTKASWTTEQSKHILGEYWALMTRSLPYALFNAGIIDSVNAEALKSTELLDDSECGPVP